MCLDLLISAAKKEDWELIDKRIPEVCNEKACIEWAYTQGLADKDRNVRDLAVSILERTRILTPEMKEKLHTLMQKDTNPFVRYRSAFALAGHDSRYHRAEVVAVLQEAKTVPDVSETASKYLKE